MDELFGDVFDRRLAPSRRGGFSPAVDVYYTADPPRAVVRADLAGIDPSEIEEMGDRVRLRFNDASRTARRVTAFAEIGPNEIGLVVDSYGLVTVVLDRHSAADELGLQPATEVRIEPFADDDDTVEGEPGVTTPIWIRTKGRA